LNNKANSATSLAGYGITDAYTKAETNSAISTAVSSKANLSEVYTQAQANAKFALISDVYSASTADALFATKTDLSNGLASKANTADG
jgi:hypothetical protein